MTPAFAVRLAVTWAAACVLVVHAAQAQTRPMGITHVTVIDVEHGRRLRDQTVIIEGTRIATVGPSDQVRIPDGYGVVEARGRFVIPGLVDTHAHLTSNAGGTVAADSIARTLARFALSGVTTVVELGAALPDTALIVAARTAGMPVARLYSAQSVASTRVQPAGTVTFDELRRAVAGGLTPDVALRAMTFDAARSIGWQGRIGTVVPGKLADFIILDANPLDDIANTAQITAIVLDGRFIDTTERTNLLRRIDPRLGR